MKKLIIVLCMMSAVVVAQDASRKLDNPNNDKYMEKYSYENPNQTIVCESLRNSRTRCAVDARYGANIIRQLSSASCDYNWGYDNQGIWVDNGCRAEFSLNRDWNQSGFEDNMMVCESHDYQRNYCTAYLQGREVFLLNQLSDSSCLNNWGYDRDGIWVTGGCRAEFVIEDNYSTENDVLICSSRNTQFQGCPADTRGGVDFVRQLSRASCNGNWGYDNQGVWVSNGCRAKFRLLPYNYPNSNYGSQDTIKCSSNNRQRKACRADTSGGVRLQKQHSNASCQGNWGYTRNQIWVDNGCRATFQLYIDSYSNNNQGYDNNNGYVNQPIQQQPQQHSNIICSSNRSGRRTCEIPNGSKVKLVQQLSNSTCVGHWGYNRREIWVENGCQAEFSVSR